MNFKSKKLLEKFKKTNISSVKKYQNKRKKELVILALVILIPLCIIGFLFSPVMKLKEINISGNNQITREDIVSVTNLNNKIKTWTIKESDVVKNIKDKYNVVKEVSVDTKLPSTITIKISEYDIIAKNKNNDGNYEVILSNGNILNSEIKNNYSIPILEGFNDNNDKKQEIYKNLTALNKDVLKMISEIVNDTSSQDLIMIYMLDGQKIKAQSATFANKLNYYLKIEKYITDKKNTTLNIINGAYIQTDKTEKQKEAKINEVIRKSQE